MKMSTSSRLIIWAISSPNKQRWFRLNCKTWKLTEKKENSSRRVTDVLSRLNYIEFLRYSTTPYFGDWHNKSILFSLYGRVKQFWFLSQNQMFLTPYFSLQLSPKNIFVIKMFCRRLSFTFQKFTISRSLYGMQTSNVTRKKPSGQFF